MSSDAEWDLLTAIVTAANRGDQAALCTILAAPETDLSDKPRCIHAAVISISLTPQNVQEHREKLKAFVAKVAQADITADMITAIRLGVLREMLCPEGSCENDDIELLPHQEPLAHTAH